MTRTTNRWLESNGHAERVEFRATVRLVNGPRGFAGCAIDKDGHCMGVTGAEEKAVQRSMLLAGIADLLRRMRAQGIAAAITGGIETPVRTRLESVPRTILLQSNDVTGALVEGYTAAEMRANLLAGKYRYVEVGGTAVSLDVFKNVATFAHLPQPSLLNWGAGNRARNLRLAGGLLEALLPPVLKAVSAVANRELEDDEVCSLRSQLTDASALFFACTPLRAQALAEACFRARAPVRLRRETHVPNEPTEDDVDAGRLYECKVKCGCWGVALAECGAVLGQRGRRCKRLCAYDAAGMRWPSSGQPALPPTHREPSKVSALRVHE